MANEPKAAHVAHIDAFRRKQGCRELRITLERWPDALGRFQVGVRAYDREPTSGIFEMRSRSGCIVYPHEIPRLIAALERAREIINAPEGEPK